jgi:AcrR family transcriptional regulator
MKKYSGPDNDSKLRILEAATSLFASKGFEGARIDEIAARAEINKAQIYYYFESKEAILEEIFERFMGKINEKLGALAQSFPDELDSFMESSQGENRIMPIMDILIDDFIDFVDAEQEVIGICVMEGVKDKEGKGPVYSFFERLIRAEMGLMKEGQSAIYGGKRFIVHEFFTALIPIASYAVFGKGIGSRFGIERGELKRLFKDSFMISHGASTSAIAQLSQQDHKG